MRSITFRAEDDLIDRARLRAARENTTLVAVFREWLAGYAAGDHSSEEIRRILHHFDGVRIGRKYSRDEMNAR